MRRALCILLSILSIGNLCVSLAEEPLGVETIYASEGMNLGSSARIDNTLYFSGEELYVYLPQTKEIKKIDTTITGENKQQGIKGNDAVQWRDMVLFADGQTLYALNYKSGAVYNIDIAEQRAAFTETAHIDITPFINRFWSEEGFVEAPVQLIVHEGVLFAICRTQDANAEIISLLSYSLSNGGTAKKRDVNFIQQLCSYKNGKMLALIQDPNNPYDTKTQQLRNATIAIYDPHTDTLDTLIDSKYHIPIPCISGIAYDAALDRIYLQGEDQIFYWNYPHDRSVLADLVPVESYGKFCGRMQVLKSGQIAVIDDRGVFLRAANNSDESNVRLHIYGGYMDDIHSRAIKAMTGTSITFSDKRFSNAGELGQALAVAGGELDILMLRSDTLDLSKIMQKGYAADLSSSQALQEYIASLYPFMSGAGTYDNKIYMIPVGVEIYGMLSYSPSILEEADGVQLPKTYDEMIDLLQKWNDELGETYPDILPYASIDYKLEMSGLAIDLYISAMISHGKDFSFLDPRFREMFIRAGALDTSNILPQVNWLNSGDDFNFDNVYSKKAIIRSDNILDLELISEALSAGRYINDGYSDLLPMPLALCKEEEPIVPINMIMMAVNPKSKNIDIAMKYVESYVNNIDSKGSAMMNPAQNDGIANASYDIEIKGIDDELIRLQRLSMDADEPQRRELNAEYELMKKYYEQRKVDRRFTVSDKAIKLYRELLNHAYIRTRGDVDILFSDNSTRNLLARYIVGQMTADQFLTEAEGKLRLIKLESE